MLVKWAAPNLAPVWLLTRTAAASPPMSVAASRGEPANGREAIPLRSPHFVPDEQPTDRGRTVRCRNSRFAAAPRAMSAADLECGAQ